MMSSKRKHVAQARMAPTSVVDALEQRRMFAVAITASLPNTSLPTGSPATTIDLGSYFSGTSATAEVATLTTTLGTITVALTPGVTPKTVANFKAYADDGSYNNTFFHRSVPGFIVQTGGYDFDGTSTTSAPEKPSVQNEFHISNIRGTIAMAKLGGQPDSATNQFFFNLSDTNASNLDSQNGGFTVFGRVMTSAGLAVIDAIAALPTHNFGSPFDQLPTRNYVTGAVTGSNLIYNTSVGVATGAYGVVSDNPAQVSVQLKGDTLTLVPHAAGTAHITVTGVGTDGTFQSQTFDATASATPAGPALAPAATGTLPASAIAGQPTKIRETVVLTASAPTTGNATVSALLRPDAGGVDVPLASLARKLKLKTGANTSVTLSATQLPASAAAGAYHVVITATDPAGLSATIATAQAITIITPTVDLSTAFGATPIQLKVGRKGTVKVVVTNHGKIPAAGNLSVTLSRSPDGTAANLAALLATTPKKVKILPGRSVTLTLGVPASQSAATYFLYADADPTNTFSDVLVANNAALSALVTVT